MIALKGFIQTVLLIYFVSIGIWMENSCLKKKIIFISTAQTPIGVMMGVSLFVVHQYIRLAFVAIW